MKPKHQWGWDPFCQATVWNWRMSPDSWNPKALEWEWGAARHSPGLDCLRHLRGSGEGYKRGLQPLSVAEQSQRQLPPPSRARSLAAVPADPSCSCWPAMVSVLLLVWGVRASALPGEERAAVANSREQTKARKEMILKMLVGLLDGMDTGREAASTDFEELESKLEEERLALGQLAQLSQRDRKAPCKNFFWKTFTSC
ncbi:LOW QUALITY PROTEIN: somatostatin-2-like [Gopherus evgoodei]|uniref:LOW QUALITY PROTEIN: somatostatin-2-like n=1 Tax=Gopherus evgoodei TaxID=1825980 RepID=UPI0011CFB20C|nr:LOW QUALITY PROTEIN: somatostatin-2-like [Gopherus evgoodei]